MLRNEQFRLAAWAAVGFCVGLAGLCHADCGVAAVASGALTTETWQEFALRRVRPGMAMRDVDGLLGEKPFAGGVGAGGPPLHIGHEVYARAGVEVLFCADTGRVLTVNRSTQTPRPRLTPSRDSRVEDFIVPGYQP